MFSKQIKNIIVQNIKEKWEEKRYLGNSHIAQTNNWWIWNSPTDG
jgi:hypothetical protein